MGELLPCPFCGGTAERGDVPADIEDDNAGGSYIQCTKCAASTTIFFDRKENLVSSWNERAYLKRALLARSLAALDNVHIRDSRSTNWRHYVARADDLLAMLSEGMSHV